MNNNHVYDMLVVGGGIGPGTFNGDRRAVGHLVFFHGQAGTFEHLFAECIVLVRHTDALDAEGESFLYSSFSVLQLSNIAPRTICRQSVVII
jgi:hypothetical protein